MRECLPGYVRTPHGVLPLQGNPTQRAPIPGVALRPLIADSALPRADVWRARWAVLRLDAATGDSPHDVTRTRSTHGRLRQEGTPLPGSGELVAYSFDPTTLRFVEQPGFRTKEIIVVSTLLDPEATTKEDLANLYRSRWNQELDIRDIKISLQMTSCDANHPNLFAKKSGPTSWPTISSEHSSLLPARELQRQMRHASMAATMRYVDLAAEMRLVADQQFIPDVASRVGG